MKRRGVEHRRDHSRQPTGRPQAPATHQTVTVAVTETTLAIELTDGETPVLRRTTETAVRSIEGSDRGSLEP